MAAGGSSTSIIASMEQDIGCSSIVQSNVTNVKKSQVSLASYNGLAIGGQIQ